jgi:UDP-glucose 4-epimerase
MSYVLVTGGAGFIGSHLVDALLEENKKVIVIDNLSMGNTNNLPKHDDLTFIKGDISDSDQIDSLFEEYIFEYIFHLGAVASVAASIDEPVLTHKTNMDATLKLLEAAKNQINLKRFIFASSAAVFGDEPTLPKTEDSAITPLTPYAIDKYSSEQYVIAYNRLYNIPTTALRFFNVYGSRQNPSSPYSGVLSILTNIFAKLQKGESGSFTMYGKGTQTRDFIYVKDVVRALLLVMMKEEAVGDIYNVGTGVETSLKEIISIYEKITNISLPIIEEEERAGDIKYSYTSIDKLRNIGFDPQYTIESGLKQYWEEVLG